MDENIREQARKRRRPLREAAWGLELAIAAPGGTAVRWCSRVHGQILEVRAALEDHIVEVESPGGLADEVSAEAPRLINLMNRLIGEHGDLREAIAQLLEMVAASPACNEDQVAMVRNAAMSLLVQISRHRQKGADLVYDKYNVDIGGE